MKIIKMFGKRATASIYLKKEKLAKPALFRRLSREEERSIARQRVATRFHSLEEMQKTSIFRKDDKSLAEQQFDCSNTNFGQN